MQTWDIPDGLWQDFAAAVYSFRGQENLIICSVTHLVNTPSAIGFEPV